MPLSVSKGPWLGGSPQILRGASSSRRIGWLRKISRDLRHRPRISFSVSCTFFPGLEPCTGSGMGRQDTGPSSRRKVGVPGSPMGTSGDAWVPPCPGAAVGAEPSGTSVSCLPGWDPNYPQGTREGMGLLCARACHPKPHSAGPISRGATLRRFLPLPKTPGQPVRPWPKRGVCSRCWSGPKPPRRAATWGSGCGRGTSRPAPVLSKLAPGTAGPPARHFRAGQGARARRAPTSPSRPTFQQAPDNRVQVEFLAVGHGGAAAPAQQLRARSCLPPSRRLLPAWAPSAAPARLPRAPAPPRRCPRALTPPPDAGAADAAARGAGLGPGSAGLGRGGVEPGPALEELPSRFRGHGAGSTVEVVFLFQRLIGSSNPCPVRERGVSPLITKHLEVQKRKLRLRDSEGLVQYAAFTFANTRPRHLLLNFGAYFDPYCLYSTVNEYIVAF